MKKIRNGLIIALMLSCFMANSQSFSPYIHQVFEYKPAPGQFVNQMPEYEAGDSQADLNRKAEASIKGQEKVLITLGGYGGYVVFGFDHMIANIEGEKDFKIWGNAFYASANPQAGKPEGGSCEPGIVMVSYDANENGLPDDPWYELAGSEYGKVETIKNYAITYYKPDEDKQQTPDSAYPFLCDTTYIRWKSNQAEVGYMPKNSFHTQPYFPLWVAADSLLFEGTKLANNYVDENGDGSYFVLYAYEWGYADNHPNSDERSSFDIAWAVDSLGNAVSLPGIHFVKVYTGVKQYCGWLGETSTEIMGAEDLHMTGNHTQTRKSCKLGKLKIYPNPCHNYLQLTSEISQIAILTNIQGVRLMNIHLEKGENNLDLSTLNTGIYLLKTTTETLKVIKNK